jgi:hypothetical protein
MIMPIHPPLENRRFVSDAGLDIARCASNYGLIAGKLAGASYLEALQFASRVARSSNGAEVAKLSEAQYRAQVEIMREYASDLFDLGRGIAVGATRPFRTQTITACCAIM